MVFGFVIAPNLFPKFVPADSQPFWEFASLVWSSVGKYDQMRSEAAYGANSWSHSAVAYPRHSAPLLLAGQQAGSPDAVATDEATIQALLVEVRQLRISLERSTSLVPRIQLATQRFQLQQDRVDRLTKELRDFRATMGSNGASKVKAVCCRHDSTPSSFRPT
jgi:hypothetical protein